MKRVCLFVAKQCLGAYSWETRDNYVLIFLERAVVGFQSHLFRIVGEANRVL